MPAETEDEDLPGDPEPKPVAKPAPAAKKAEPEPEPAVPAKPTRSKFLLDAVAELGYAEADLGDMSNDEAWEAVERTRKGRTAPAAKPEPKVAVPEADPEEAYLAELEASHAPLANMLRKSKAKIEAMEKAAKEKDEVIGHLTKAEMARQQKAFDRSVDAAFDALPEEYHDYTGTGSFGKLADPVHKSVRTAVYQAAKIDGGKDSAEQIAAKIAAAAEAVVGSRVKKAAEPASAYEAAAKARKPQPKDAKNGRYTADEFEKGHVHKPGGKATAADPLDDVEQARRYFKEIGDPRGSHAGVSLDDDDLPG